MPENPERLAMPVSPLICHPRAIYQAVNAIKALARGQKARWSSAAICVALAEAWINPKSGKLTPKGLEVAEQPEDDAGLIAAKKPIPLPAAMKDDKNDTDAE